MKMSSNVLKPKNLGFKMSIFPNNIGPARATLKIFATLPAGWAIGPGRAENLEHLFRASRDLNQLHGKAHMRGMARYRADKVLKPS